LVVKRDTSYEAWLRQEGIPVIEGYGVEDVTELPRKPWARTGGQGAYIQLTGMEGFTGMYVGEIPAGGSLNIERHLYEKIIYILHGFGATEVWSGNNEKKENPVRVAARKLVCGSPQLFAPNDQWQPRAGCFLGRDERAFDDRSTARRSFCVWL
jgi:hypothetical protein